jgi:hypothetical protein
MSTPRGARNGWSAFQRPACRRSIGTALCQSGAPSPLWTHRLPGGRRAWCHKHLSIGQVRAVIASRSIYVAFPFLAGTRISEQLGVVLDCVDLNAGVVHIKRIQDKQTGKLIETTKTTSGQRIIPMSERYAECSPRPARRMRRPNREVATGPVTPLIVFGLTEVV